MFSDICERLIVTLVLEFIVICMYKKFRELFLIKFYDSDSESMNDFLTKKRIKKDLGYRIFKNKRISVDNIVEIAKRIEIKIEVKDNNK